MEKLGDVLGNINRVLVRIQHAIIRNHKGNTISALDCLVNEKGETPSTSCTTQNLAFADFSKRSDNGFPIVIGGVSQTAYINTAWLSEFVCFYGIGDGLCKDGLSNQLIEGKVDDARKRLSRYLASCLG